MDIILNPIVIEDVIDTNQKVLVIEGKVLEKGEIHNLKEEAKFLVKTRLWSILTNTLTDQAHKVMFVNSKTFDDMVAGKTMLYNIDIQKKIVDKILNFKIE